MNSKNELSIIAGFTQFEEKFIFINLNQKPHRLKTNPLNGLAWPEK